MAKRQRVWNQAKYESYLKSGRGQGEGSKYLPWISIHDLSSKGLSSRVFSYKTNRVHHFLSHNELCFFYMLEWSNQVLDIREQFPMLDVKLATDIAKRAGIRYPRDNISGFPYILTCDFMIITENGLKARTIKSVSDLKNKRTLEKLEIERRYWDTFGIDWSIVTEHGIDFQNVKRIEWLYTSAILPKHLEDLKYREEILKRIESTSIQKVATWFDAEYEYPAGSGLHLIKHMMWHKEIDIEIDSVMNVIGR